MPREGAERAGGEGIPGETAHCQLYFVFRARREGALREGA